MTEQQLSTQPLSPSIEDHITALRKTYDELEVMKRKVDEDLKTVRATLKTLERHTKK